MKLGYMIEGEYGQSKVCVVTDVLLEEVIVGEPEAYFYWVYNNKNSDMYWLYKPPVMLGRYR